MGKLVILVLLMSSISFGCQFDIAAAAGPAPFQEIRLVSLEEAPYLAHHMVKGKVVLPGAYLIEWALSAVARMTSGSDVEIKNVRIPRPVILENGSPQALTLTIDGDALTIKNGDHTCMKAKMGNQAIAPFVRYQPDVAPDIEGLYNFLSTQGLDYGPSFRTLSLVNVNSRAATGVLSLHPEVKANASIVHPTILDGAFHALAAILFTQIESQSQRATFIPALFGSVRYRKSNHPRVINSVYGEITAGNSSGISYQLELNDREENPVLQISEGTFLKM